MKDKENGKIIYLLWLLLFGVCMAGMLYYSAHKTITIADAYQEENANLQESGYAEHGKQEVTLQLEEDTKSRECFHIPLPSGIKAEHVVMENHYMEKELWVFVQSEQQEFYKENVVYGALSPVLSGCSGKQQDGILLKFKMDKVLEYKSTMEENRLTIAYFNPKELYPYIMVLDAAGGGTENGGAGRRVYEKEVVLQAARLVQKKLSGAEIRVYMTRTEDVDVSPEARVALAEEVKADFYVRLSTAAGEPESYGIRSTYNEEYFIPVFGSEKLADVLTRETAIAASNRALGIFDAGEESLLNLLSVRGAELSIGYLTNEKEEELLMQQAYQEKLAEGISKAILEACEELKTAEEQN